MKTKRLIASAIALLVIVGAVYAGPPEEGKTIFTARCAACHNVNKVLTGPALAKVDERRSVEWIINFVKSSQTVIKKGDADAVQLFQRFNGIVMPDHPDLSEENIKNIIAYIKQETVEVDASIPFSKPTKLQTPYRPLSLSKDYMAFLIYVVIVALLVKVLLFAVRVKEMGAPK